MAGAPAMRCRPDRTATESTAGGRRGQTFGVFQAFFLSPPERRFLHEHTLTLVALPGSAEAYGHRREDAVLPRPPRKRRIAPGQVNEMIEIVASKPQGPLAVHMKEGAFG
jgi:hypothetical protein